VGHRVGRAFHCAFDDLQQIDRGRDARRGSQADRSGDIDRSRTVRHHWRGLRGDRQGNPIHRSGWSWPWQSAPRPHIAQSPLNRSGPLSICHCLTTLASIGAAKSGISGPASAATVVTGVRIRCHTADLDPTVEGRGGRSPSSSDAHLMRVGQHPSKRRTRVFGLNNCSIRNGYRAFSAWQQQRIVRLPSRL
jgi:hypothetical protein